jgi:uncharacterized protein (TIGR02687 family)
MRMQIDMDERIIQALKAAFEKDRIVFWYDTKQEMRAHYDQLELSDVIKLEINNNEFGIKYRMLRQEPKQKFLIYKHGPEPESLVDNWLLDVQLAHTNFRTDQAQLWLNELGLDIGFTETIKDHEEFFRSKKRVIDLKTILLKDDTASKIKMKMLRVCAGSSHDMEDIIATLFEELSEDKDDSYRLISRCNLDEFFWDLIKRQYGYKNNKPKISDFALELFKSCFALGQNEPAVLNNEAQVLLKRWKNDKNNFEAFETLSKEYEQALAVKASLDKRDFRKLIEIDYFEEIDRFIIRNLVAGLSAQTFARSDMQAWTRARRKSHWYNEYFDLYEALSHASEFLHEIASINLNMDDFADGINRYVKTWYKIDYLYRKFIYHLKKSHQPTLLGDISALIENRYSNDYLLRLNNAWQLQVDRQTNWLFEAIANQRSFYKDNVASLRSRDVKAVVIISDALRYEIGEELVSRIREQDRFQAKLDYMVSTLPSYTQLGMASLLPHLKLSITDDDTGHVQLDGLPTSGLENRRKVLEANAKGSRISAWRADDFLEKRIEETKEIIRDHDIIYIYHNRIDAIGDAMKTEENVFEAAEETVIELVKLVRKLTSSNASQVLITADHGFIYQNKDLDESEYLSERAEGEQILFNDRRFVLGHGLKETAGFKKFTSKQLGLDGSVEVLLPKSINRLRRKGSGAKYVHGGASLQEIVVPVLRITKGRENDTAYVDVAILAGNNKSITTSQIAVTLYQQQAVTDKLHKRKLRLGIYANDGQLLSDTHEIVFDFASDNTRDREVTIQLLLSKQADEYNNKEVSLRLDEQHGDTSHYKEYASIKYMIKRSFTNDFDF